MKVRIRNLAVLEVCLWTRLETFLKYFSSEVPSSFMTKLCEASANPIYELELLPVLVAYLCWRQHLVSCQTVFYLDTDAARAGLTKALGATQHADKPLCIKSCPLNPKLETNHGTVAYPLLRTFQMIPAEWSALILTASVANDVRSSGHPLKCKWCNVASSNGEITGDGNESIKRSLSPQCI